MTEHNYFGSHETQCKCGCGMDIKPELRSQLNVLREAYGHPIVVYSGARCKDYNRRIGGAVHSAHTLGLAADLGFPSSKKRRWKLIHECTRFFGNLGFYSGFIHVDLRDGHRYWTG